MALGKGYERKNVYFTFVMKSQLLAAKWGLCFEEGEKRKSVYLTFVTARRRFKVTRTEVRDSRKTVGTR